MDEFIPIENVIKENPRVKELEKQGFIIKPKNIEDYLNQFKNQNTALPDEKYWKEKRVLITGINGFTGSHLAE